MLNNIEQQMLSEIDCNQAYEASDSTKGCLLMIAIYSAGYATVFFMGGVF